MAKKKLAPTLDGKHPLVALLDRGFTVNKITAVLGHANHTTVSGYLNRARKNKYLNIPAEWVLPLARASGARPHDFRPDLYLPEWSVDNAIEV